MMITVIILTKDEEMHIERCIRSLRSVTNSIFVVDSFSTDRTALIARGLGATVVQREWVNYADQFQWAIDNCGGTADWLMRMDADEYIDGNLTENILTKLPHVPEAVAGIYINRKHIFHEKWIKFGGRYPLTLLRIWRRGQGSIEKRWMDEHILLPYGAGTLVFEGALIDHNLKGIDFFISKHNSYATREALDAIRMKDVSNQHMDHDLLRNMGESQAGKKRFLKNNYYYASPPILRAFLYFFYRYFIQLGFLDGMEGFVYHFLQGLWYRLLVDIKISEFRLQKKIQ